MMTLTIHLSQEHLMPLDPLHLVAHPIADLLEESVVLYRSSDSNQCISICLVEGTRQVISAHGTEYLNQRLHCNSPCSPVPEAKAPKPLTV